MQKSAITMARQSPHKVERNLSFLPPTNILCWAQALRRSTLRSALPVMPAFGYSLTSPRRCYEVAVEGNSLNRSQQSHCVEKDSVSKELGLSLPAVVARMNGHSAVA